MRPTTPTSPQPINPSEPPWDDHTGAPFHDQWITVRKSDWIKLKTQANYWESYHQRDAQKITELEQQITLQTAEIKDLRARLFGKKTEKTTNKPDSENNTESEFKRPRGQQKGKPSHGRTGHSPKLKVVEETIPYDPLQNCCPQCGLPPIHNESLDEVTEIKEIQVQAYIRRIRRKAHVPGCKCGKLPTISTPPPPPRLIPRSGYGVSFWTNILITKFHYQQPTYRLLEDLHDQGMPVSQGTVTDNLKRLGPLFEPINEALYCYQMQEQLFNCDETRWEVFVKLEEKIGSRWYLWVMRSTSVIFYDLAPTRSAAVPGAHFVGLKNKVSIIVCDRYSAYKKLARLSDDTILLAFCWAHVRRDFLDAGKSFTELEPWALDWKERIGELYHLNQQRLKNWEPKQPISAQNEKFYRFHATLKESMDAIQGEAKELAEQDTILSSKSDEILPISQPARNEQCKIARSLLEHWKGLSVFVDQPQVPMDNNLAENAIRGPVTGRKNYYGSGSLWSADLTAVLFSIFQTLSLWNIPVRPWLQSYLQACAENGGQAPADITPFLPWAIVEAEGSSPPPLDTS